LSKDNSAVDGEQNGVLEKQVNGGLGPLDLTLQRVVDKIIGVTDVEGVLVYFIKWKGKLIQSFLGRLTRFAHTFLSTIMRNELNGNLF
jgi:hypothetical protein